jgi:hypothetical protein
MPRKKKIAKKKGVRRTRTVEASAVPKIDDIWPPIGSVQLGPYTLQAGEYWIGDLYNVLTYESWEEIGETHGYKKLSNNMEVVRFKLPEGSGTYIAKTATQENEKFFFIDGGTVGITLLSGLGAQARETGHVFVFPEEFQCTCITVAHPQGGGYVSFNDFGGKVVIDSDDQVYTTTPSLREKLAAHKFATRMRAC